MKRLKLRWVSDVIGDEYKKWQRGDIVLLEAQTGTGKTWFVKNVLVDYLGENQKLLLVCNRTYLKRQLKIDLLNKFNDDKDVKIPYQKDKDGKETDKIDFDALDKITTIKNITITSYHAIQHSVLNEKYDNKYFDLTMYEYIVLDECHYIMADGSFNNKTRFAFEKLVGEHRISVTKIFISATMQELKEPIIKCSKYAFGESPKVHEYSTGIDYSYLSPKYYNNDISTIINTIKNDKTDEKWLIFISKLKDGEKILEELGRENCSLIQSGATTDREELQSIINESRFHKKVLIATKALDNGINISDVKLTNLVIMTWDRITFIQMIGRKRILLDEPWQDVNLYIPTRFKKSFLTRMHLFEVKQGEIRLLEENKNAFGKKYDNDLKDLSGYNDIFYREKMNGDWKVNPIGRMRLIKDIEFASYMTDKFDREGKFAFILEQLKWLGLSDTFDETKLIGDVQLEEHIETLEELLNKFIGTKVLKEDQIELKKLLTNEAFRIDKKLLRGINNMHTDTFNSIMEHTLKLPYRVTARKTSERINGKPKKYTYWTIAKLIEE